jgi:hypothetical protein
VLVDHTGEELAVLAQEGLRLEVHLHEVAPVAVDALIVPEDRRFYDHGGVDPTGIARAQWNNVTDDSTQGGSTLTQQLVKNTHLTSDRTSRPPPAPGSTPLRPISRPSRPRCSPACCARRSPSVPTTTLMLPASDATPPSMRWRPWAPPAVMLSVAADVPCEFWHDRAGGTGRRSKETPR